MIAVPLLVSVLQAAAPAPTTGVWRGCDERHCLIDLEFTRLEVERPAEGNAPGDIATHSAVLVAVDRDTASVRSSPAGTAHRLRITARTDISYPAIGGGHYLKSVSRAGDLVTLEDGSTWEIHPRLHFEVAAWEPSAGIAIRRAAPEDGFPYEMTNLEADAGVAARYRPR